MQLLPPTRTRAASSIPQSYPTFGIIQTGKGFSVDLLPDTEPNWPISMRATHLPRGHGTASTALRLVIPQELTPSTAIVFVCSLTAVIRNVYSPTAAQRTAEPHLAIVSTCLDTVPHSSASSL